ncbi:hypothetical protein METBIDRAFT_79397 [Metschnikowia bicuspidata var. bicuspidata NRRL YB-4993]|uniref:LicD/FKTN/FKRP nucleotidyltransferase domain-containing protein n=1 Tax=Metschnikowia bicuspidata var. bicuspidata NRRL YB-4993 TaxID=869754 RepID=A0A1A0H7M6_9ASCO|nr:hypothetical protein METBIDRAFT_79397 [Metschnikowia bicuspidata var. bicuspidata NRRL YB-4993]OBA20099.1 hypothetical protein METBIDRAFT_79397 [Metschnikowia bicuspidata var. bicuspidata NRRL YB-4993]
MSFTKFYQKRIAVVVLILLCFLLSFINSLFKDISDNLLDDISIELQAKSKFDPRAITYELFSYIQSKSTSSSLGGRALQRTSLLDNQNGIYFHWDDWVNLSPGNSYLEKAREYNPDGACELGLCKFSQVNPYFMESYDTKVNRAMTNLYCVKDIPKRILVATDTGYFELPVTGKRRLALLDAEEKFSKTIKFLKYQPVRKSIDISPQDFNFDIDKEILSLKEASAIREILVEDKEHLKFLEASNLMVDLADRFFKYPWIYSDIVAGRSHHTSFPFFKRFISSKERQSVIQHMVRAWFQFSETSGVNTWVNYGSLLGWAYNGVNLPWDTDVDIQIPIAQLDKLSRRFNSTIITENPRYGNAKYLFEVSPTYTRQGNGRNFIDARFIEINTGLYIDISVLAHTGDQPPQSLLSSLSDEEKMRAIPVHCKNWNWHILDEILPIRLTYFEDSPVYIPNNILSILLRKYGSDSFTSRLLFNGHHYDKQLKLWIPDTEDSRGCVLNPNSLGTRALSNECKSSWIEDEFKIVHDAAKCHDMFDSDIDRSAAETVHDYPKLTLTRKDPYDYFQDIIERKTNDLGWFVEQY